MVALQGECLMKDLRCLAALASIGMTVLSAPALAQDKPHENVTVEGARGCKMELLNVVPLHIENDQLTVPVDINGKTRTFQIDTAAIANQMTDAAARAMGLRPRDFNYGAPRITGNASLAIASQPVRSLNNTPTSHPLEGDALSPERDIYDTNGRSYSALAKVDDLVMQTMEDKDVEFHISPLPPANVDGVLDMELFNRFDVDLNFVDRRFNLFSKDHCSGKILYWRAPGVAALPYAIRDHRILTHVMLEGKDLTAIIDTGSPVSILRFDVATPMFGVHPGDAGVTPMSAHRDDIPPDLYTYNFKTLSFGTVAIGNPRLALTRSTVLVKGEDPHARTGSLIASDSRDSQPDMIIGMDLLKLMHLYIAQGEGMLYLTEGSELYPGDAAAQPTIPVTPFRP